jgi:molecular chaperone GrpE
LSQDPADPEDDGPKPGGDPSLLDAVGGLAAVEPPPNAGAAEHLERRARLAEDRLTEVLAAYRQVRTDNEGFRDRVKREAERQFDRRREKLVLKFIEILDNLDRALEAAEITYAGNPLVEGLILVRSQLLHTLQHEGLERIPVLGLPYDPEVAEAVSLQRVDDPESDQVVVRELLRGYRLYGRVARAAHVIIGSYEASAASEAEDAELVGGSEAGAEPADDAELDPAAETLKIDETMLREIFGDGTKPPDD